MFRRIDWIAFWVVSIVVMTGYMLTLAPNQTLEDSGELATASLYAGIPHPPGYPMWTLYTWVFTKLVPFNNIAWRVGVASAFAGAISCGLIAMMVSRGSKMLLGCLPEFKELGEGLEQKLSFAAGFVSGLLMGFNGYYWSQAVIVEVYTLSVLSLVAVMIFLMRWLYAPHQRRWLYYAMFCFGICFTNHQTLIVAAIGIEVMIAAAQPKLGRDLFFGNTVIYLGALLGKAAGGLAMFSGNPPLWVIFNVIGVFSIITFVWLCMQTRGLLSEWLPVFIMGLLWVAGAAFYFYMPLASMSTPPLNWGYPRTVEGFFHALTRGQYEKANPANIIDEPDRFAGQLWQYFIGCVDEFNLVYLLIGVVPFIVLIVALLRDGAAKDLRWLGMINSGIVVLFMLAALLSGLAKANGWNGKPLVHLVWFFLAVLVLIDLLVLVHVMIRFLHQPERSWMSGLSTIYLGLALLLLILLNPAPDRQSKELNRVFFTSSHVMLAMWTGYGLAIIGALLATQYERFRRAMLWLTGLSAAVALYAVVVVFSTGASWRERDPMVFDLTRWFDLTPMADPLSRATALFGLALAVVPLAIFFLRRDRVPMTFLLGLFLVLPSKSVLSHWWDNEQRGHLFGYWFGHDMFTPPYKDKQGKPLYPEMDRDTVLFGGTDPGRFNPTYMIYCESFIPSSARQSEDPNFDRRDVYLITQNALADATYLSYIRAHYNRSAQKDPPFFSEFFKTDLLTPLDKLFTGLGDRIETSRRGGSSLFDGEHFTDLAGMAARLKDTPEADPLSKYLRSKLSPATRERINRGDTSRGLASALAKDFNMVLEDEFKARRELETKLDELVRRFANDPAARDREIQAALSAYRGNTNWLYHSNQIGHIQFTPRLRRFIAQDLSTGARLRTGRQIFEANYGKLIKVSEGGVYPDLEILTPTLEDSQKAFQDYIVDAQKRLEHDRRFPNEPRQIKPGEDVRIDNGRVQVSGQIAVMAINGLLTKVIFDKNPDHEFFVEESFPLDWMYPYLTPSGIIMKINRQPLPELTDDIVNRDKEFWSQYSERLVGNWIKDDTSVKQICDFAEKAYLRRDLSDYRGSMKFIRDDNAQKAFSKLRSAIGGVYAWRINSAKTPAERARMIAAADFAYRQAFAFCPFSPEATFRYINLLVPLGRIDDALMIATTCKKLDPENGAVVSLVEQLKGMKGPSAAGAGAVIVPPNPGVVSSLATAQQMIQQGQRGEAAQLLERLLDTPNADAQFIMAIAGTLLQLQEMPRLEKAMFKMTNLMPQSPEAYYDLSAVQAVLNKQDEAIKTLSRSLELNAARKSAQPGARDLAPMAASDMRFINMRERADFKKLVPNFAVAAPAPVQLTSAPALAKPPAAPKK